MTERRHDYIDIETKLASLTVMVGNLSLVMNEVKAAVKEQAEKNEARDRLIEARINELESYKDKVVGTVTGISIGGSSLVIALQDKILSFFKHI